MFKIYVIEDCNGLKYVGQTKQNLNARFRSHKSEKKTNKSRSCMSKLLDLDNCQINCIDIADSKEEANVLEKILINSIDCVNINKGNFDRKKAKREWHQKNKDKINEKRREIYHQKKLLGSS